MMMFTAAFQPSKAVFTKASSSPSSFATLSRQFSSLVLNVPAAAPSCPGGANNQQQVRSMATNRKAIDTKNAKRLKIQAKKKKNTNLAGKTGVSGGENCSLLQLVFTIIFASLAHSHLLSLVRPYQRPTLSRVTVMMSRPRISPSCSTKSG